MIDITNAKDEVNKVVDQLAESVADLTNEMTARLDALIKKVALGVDLMTNAEIRETMAKISVEAYSIGILKEQNSLRDACASALYKEAAARSFSTTAGSVEAKKNQSILDTLDRQAVSILYNTSTNLLKTKCDEAHRIVSVLSNILISRAAEAKNQYSPRSELDQMPYNNDENGDN